MQFGIVGLAFQDRLQIILLKVVESSFQQKVFFCLMLPDFMCVYTCCFVSPPSLSLFIISSFLHSSHMHDAIITIFTVEFAYHVIVQLFM